MDRQDGWIERLVEREREKGIENLIELDQCTRGGREKQCVLTS